MSDTAMTPREYCASRHSLPFGEHKRRRKGPDFIKVGRGLMAVVDGSKEQRVAPGLIFAYELDEAGNPQLYSYWVAPEQSVWAKYRHHYTVGSIKRCVVRNRYRKIKSISYGEMCRMIRREYGKKTWIPPEDWLMIEYGIEPDVNGKEND